CAEALAQVGDEMVERARGAELHALAPALLGEHLPRAVPRDETWRGMDAFDLAAQLELQIVALQREPPELAPRGALVQDRARIRQGILRRRSSQAPGGAPGRRARRRHRRRGALSPSRRGS